MMMLYLLLLTIATVSEDVKIGISTLLQGIDTIYINVYSYLHNYIVIVKTELATV